MVSHCNQAALRYIESWPHWAHPVLVLHGPSGSGKSHLLNIWQDLSRDLTIDDFDKNIGDHAYETELFHIYNQVIEHKKFLLLSAEKPPAQLGFVLPDLASRLRSCPSISIDPPDDALISALLVKLFADRQLTLPPEVLSYCLPRLERSFDHIRQFVAAVDTAAMAEKRAVTIPLVRTLLST